MSHETFKSEMVQFDPEDIPEESRPQVVRVLLSMLFSKLFDTKGIKGNSHLTINKKTVLSFLSRLRPAELQSLYVLILDYHGISQEGSCAWNNSSE